MVRPIKQDDRFDALRKALESILRDRGVGAMVDVAQEIGINPKTLYNFRKGTSSPATAQRVEEYLLGQAREDPATYTTLPAAAQEAVLTRQLRGAMAQELRALADYLDSALPSPFVARRFVALLDVYQANRDLYLEGLEEGGQSRGEGGKG